MTDDDLDLLTLDEACATLLRGLVKPATLRAASKRGELVLERLGRRDVVTPAAIRDWREKCRDPRNRRGYGSGRAIESATPNGSSSTPDPKSAADAAREIAMALKESSRDTSPESGGRKGRGIRTVSPSPTSSASI